MASTTPGGAIHGYLGAQSVEAGVAEEDSVSTLDVSMVWGRRALAPVCWTGDLSEWLSGRQQTRHHEYLGDVGCRGLWADDEHGTKKGHEMVRGDDLGTGQQKVKSAPLLSGIPQGYSRCTQPSSAQLQGMRGARRSYRPGHTVPKQQHQQQQQPQQHQSSDSTITKRHRAYLRLSINMGSSDVNCQKAHRTSLTRLCASDSYNLAYTSA
ncbi:hypothetical protein GE21DRAFT_3376 [Neurospora crassa]|uniref:Uncharacterized protein n=2 Tax=Neurospora crassa TaxID=5141 RepID=Q1K4M3_NEUCR|nr:hypothetical protein NCU01631 [Neurospora crassa OR74A]EAA26550.1 hypothetical protein NCU01631 [Neurospora crassa OR74A]KHE78455.1 hypothetical protein GE21DRAFT_3376 [Neurospora crassa]CAD01119.1 conserved hypothetical protein [Neurospora crassa]|eukprot:XP_955786.1 hypothetical protein NCU01631 [Neurospora crassa OR74A]